MMEALIGFATGVIASMGLGGGFVLMIWLTVFAQVGQREAQGINLLFFLPIALISLIIHIRGGLINKELLKKYLLGGIIGALLGSLAMQSVPTELLRKLFAMFLLSFGIRELFASPRQEDEQEKRPDLGT